MNESAQPTPHDESAPQTIDITKLSNADIGRWVIYTRDNSTHTEMGRIKSWNNTLIFVVYNCGGNWRQYREYTAAGTRGENLQFTHEPKGVMNGTM